MEEKSREWHPDENLLHISCYAIVAFIAVILVAAAGKPPQIPDWISKDLVWMTGTLTMLWIINKITGFE